MRSARRGTGSDVAGSRPYRPGDDVDTIDWNASARLSSARGTDEFVVRERYAEEAPRVVLVCDHRPEMSFFSPPLPWLAKGEAMRRACELILESALAARSFIGYLDFADGSPLWHPPRSQRGLFQPESRRSYGAPPDTVGRALEHLIEHRRALPSGTFIFVLSDFLSAPPPEAWMTVVAQRWDVVPVVIQDPVWEQTFPELDGLVVPFSDPRTGRVTDVRLGRGEARARREHNERRFAELVSGFRSFDLEPVLLSSSDRDSVLGAFLAWSERRLYWRGPA